MTNVRFPVNDLIASRSRRRPASAPNKILRRALRKVVGAGREQRWIGLAYNWQDAIQRIALVMAGKEGRIAYCQ
jgi:hypothetical protein